MADTHQLCAAGVPALPWQFMGGLVGSSKQTGDNPMFVLYINVVTCFLLVVSIFCLVVYYDVERSLGQPMTPTERHSQLQEGRRRHRSGARDHGGDSGTAANEKIN